MTGILIASLVAIWGVFAVLMFKAFIDTGKWWLLAAVLAWTFWPIGYLVDWSARDDTAYQQNVVCEKKTEAHMVGAMMLVRDVCVCTESE